MKKEENSLPAWLTQAELDNWYKTHAKIDIITVESILEKGKQLELAISPPDEIAFMLSSEYMSNIGAGNNISKAQMVMAERCTRKCEPDLVKEMEDESIATRHQIAIGILIGKLYKMPETKLKKSFNRPS